MKKNYNKPTLQVVKVENSHILCASGQTVASA